MNGDIPDSAMVGFYHKGFSQIIVNTCLWSLYLVLFPISLRALFRNRAWTRANVYLGITTLVMFTITNIYFFVFLRFQTSIIEVMLSTNGPEFSNLRRLQLAQDGIKGVRVIEALPRLFNFILGDGVVVHRAFVIVGVQTSDHPRRVLILRAAMILLFLVSIGFSIYDGYLSIVLGTQSLQFALAAHSNIIPDITAVSLSFFTNFVATISIVITTRHQILPSFVVVSPSNTSRAASRAFRQVVHLLVLLTETAVIYCVLQFIAIVILTIPAKGADQTDIATGAYLSALNILSALYPTILIILFSRQSQGKDLFGIRMTDSELQHGEKGSLDGIHVGSASMPQTLTFPSQMGGQRLSNTSEESDEWQKARGSYTNFIV
ncbi:hypothetical protein DL96DRAFT_1582203 [Flagelloscypha sp. PMI_526]|nr:hypothetical protein DL96DRAFT_1582203 [Flagelloscypha sp. PMI_526]